MANIRNLDRAPKFRKLVEADHDILGYKDRRVMIGTEMPPVEETAPITVGVKPQGRPRLKGVLQTSKAIAGVHGTKGKWQKATEDPPAMVPKETSSKQPLPKVGDQIKVGTAVNLIGSKPQ